MNKYLLRAALIGALALTVCAKPAASLAVTMPGGGPDVCSLLSSGEAAAIMGDPNVTKRGGVPGFVCAWNSPGNAHAFGHDIAIMVFTEAKIRQIGGRPLMGIDPSLASAFRAGSPLALFQAMSKRGSRCQGYSGNLPCTLIEKRIALYKHSNGSDYVVMVFAQRDEGHGDAGLIRLPLEAARIASRIGPRLP